MIPVRRKIIKQGPTLGKDDVQTLTLDFSAEEIKQAIWDIPINKSPGIDGFESGFYRHAWNIIGKDVVEAV